MPRLVCEACGERDETGRGHEWRAMLGRDDDDSVTAVVLCPMCAFDFDLHASTSLKGASDGDDR